MISGAAQADVCLLMVPADGNFTTAIQKGDHKAGEIQGQTRQHARLINLLGVKQLIIGVNKMDSDTAGYKQERYTEIANEMKHMLVRVGWKDAFVEKSVPIIPISGWMGDNLIKESTNMTWWKGVDVETRECGLHALAFQFDCKRSTDMASHAMCHSLLVCCRSQGQGARAHPAARAERHGAGA
jgi:translation elongation factor EF-1alpha